MHRQFATPLIALTLLASGCSTIDDWGGIVPTAVGSAPFVYHPPVQQGNVITQEMVNQLRPGMTKSQVRYILGTPTLVDAFHQDRWDYYHRMVEDGVETERYRLTLFFTQDELTSMDGDFRPKAGAAVQEKGQQVYTVPEAED